MKTRICGITAFAVLFVSMNPGRAADSPADIIDKAIKAKGGEEVLAKAKAEEWKVKGTMHMFGMMIPYTGDYVFAAPDKFYFGVTAELGGQKITIKAGADGKAPWESAAGKVEDMKEKKANAFLHSIYTMNLSLLLPLKSKDYTLALADETKIDDKPAVGVKVTMKGHPDVTLWFDKESGLLVRINTRIWDEFSDKDVPQEVSFIDYKKKDGQIRFNKLVIKRDGKTLLEETLSDQKTLEKVDPKIFAKP